MCVTFSTIHIITPNMQGKRRNNTMESISFCCCSISPMSAIWLMLVLLQLVQSNAANHCIPFKYYGNLMHMKSCRIPSNFPVRFAAGAAFGSVSFLYHLYARVLRSFQRSNTWYSLSTWKMIARSFAFHFRTIPGTRNVSNFFYCTKLMNFFHQNSDSHLLMYLYLGEF